MHKVNMIKNLLINYLKNGIYFYFYCIPKNIIFVNLYVLPKKRLFICSYKNSMDIINNLTPSLEIALISRTTKHLVQWAIPQLIKLPTIH